MKNIIRIYSSHDKNIIIQIIIIYVIFYKLYIWSEHNFQQQVTLTTGNRIF